MSNINPWAKLDKHFAKYKGKRVTVLHSGGFDSNMLIMALACAGADVHASGIAADNLGASSTHNGIERGIRKLFIDRLVDRENSKLAIRRSTSTLQMGSNGVTRYRWQQMIMWIGLMPLISRSDDDVVCVGYIMGDEAISNLDKIKKVWDSQKWCYEYGNVETKLEFPLSRVHKAELEGYARYLIEQHDLDPTVLNLNWLCELNTGGWFNTCGHCPSCRSAKVNRVAANRTITSNISNVFKTYGEIFDVVGTGIDRAEDQPAALLESVTMSYEGTTPEKSNSAAVDFHLKDESVKSIPFEILRVEKELPPGDTLLDRILQAEVGVYYEELQRIDETETIESKEVEHEA